MKRITPAILADIDTAIDALVRQLSATHPQIDADLLSGHVIERMALKIGIHGEYRSAESIARSLRYRRRKEAEESSRAAEAYRAPQQQQPPDTAAILERQRQQREYFERMRQEEEQRMQEREREAKLGLEIIREGRNIIAKKLHPDVGGSTRDMTLLNRATARLKTNV